ncbi:MAG: peptidoglycan bridge formation glycyltransferase FemA/FemB family protein [Parcubacteria group bacterium]|nr:peptidoglycan bridge formation glycyltransferase FemA/FemB family protein [Parcubacteria group bacterium]
MNKELWDKKATDFGGEFLQSWEWGEFQESLGKKVIKFFDDDLGLAQIVITSLPLGLSWAYVPRGPVFFNPERAQDLADKIVRAMPAGCVFVVLEPADRVSLSWKKFKPRQPVETVALDLSQSEGELLDAMNPKTRYSIRRSLTSGLDFAEVEDVSEFYKLLVSTARRQSFRTYPEIYFKRMVEAIGKSNVKILGARHQGKLLSAGLFVIFGSTAFYLHSGSDYESHSLMAPYFMHWEAIKYFRARGLKSYDFWGIDAQRWPGITRFKTRFGGTVKTYPGAYVKVLKPFWFGVYQLAKKFNVG